MINVHYYYYYHHRYYYYYVSTAAGQQFTSSPQQLTVMQGSNVTLPCHLTNLGKPSPCPRLTHTHTALALPSAVPETTHWTVTALGCPLSRPGNSPLDSHTLAAALPPVPGTIKPLDSRTLHSTALPSVPETTHWTVTHCPRLPSLPSRKQPTGQSHIGCCPPSCPGNSPLDSQTLHSVAASAL